MSETNQWVKVYESEDSIKTDIIKDYLINQYDIQAVVLNKKISAYHIGKCEIMVVTDQVDDAKAAIEQFENIQ